MAVREPHSLRREPVDLRRGNLAAIGIVALHVAVTEIVGKNNDDVGSVRRRGNLRGVERGQGGQQQDDEGSQGLHGGVLLLFLLEIHLFAGRGFALDHLAGPRIH